MRYPGGKGKCFQHLINLMPPHETYIESHLGGGAVLRNKQPAKRSIGIDRDPKVVEHWRQEFDGYCELVEADAVAYMDAFPFSGNELVYADPPYLPETRRQKRIYAYEYDRADHETLLSTLRNLPCHVMVSGYDSQLYNDMLSGWRRVTFSAKTQVDVREECVWLNFQPCQSLHDTRYLGSNYRERQTVKRRQERLQARIGRMSAVERHELIVWLNKTYGETGERA